MKSFSTLAPLNISNTTFKSGAAYITCNEQNQQNTINQLQTNAITNREVHIGFSLWFNLDIIAATQPQYAILLDFDTKMLHVYEQLGLALVESTREQFIERFLTRLVQRAKELDTELLPFPLDYQKQLLENDLIKGYGFLASDADYERVRRMHIDGRIFFGCADLTNTNDISLVVNWCKDNKLKIGTLYLSNIMEWVFENGAKDARMAITNNIKRMRQDSTLVIDAFYESNKKSGSGPPQHITEPAQQLKYLSMLNNKTAGFLRTKNPSQISEQIDDNYSPPKKKY